MDDTTDAPKLKVWSCKIGEHPTFTAEPAKVVPMRKRK